MVAARFELARVFPTGSQASKLKSSALDHSATLPIHGKPDLFYITPWHYRGLLSGHTHYCTHWHSGHSRAGCHGPALVGHIRGIFLVTSVSVSFLRRSSNSRNTFNVESGLSLPSSQKPFTASVTSLNATKPTSTNGAITYVVWSNAPVRFRPTSISPSPCLAARMSGPSTPRSSTTPSAPSMRKSRRGQLSTHCH